MKGIVKIDKEANRQGADYRRSLYLQNPGVESFVRARKLCVCLLLFLLLFHEALNLLPMLQGASFPLQEFCKLLVHAVILCVTLLSGWKGSLLLYLPAVPSLLSLIMTVQAILLWYGSLSGFWAASSPQLKILFLVDAVYTAGLLLLAVWLTLFPQSRRMADRAREIYTEYSRFISHS